MNSVWKKVSGVVLSAVLAFVIVAPGLQAGPVAGGQFKLPFDAQWGKVGLSTGDYTFAINHVTVNGTIFVYRDGRAAGVVRPETFDSDGSRNKKSELVFVRHDGKATVRALTLPGIGTFYFPLPKQLKTLVAQQPELIETVPVASSGE
jgi:hypothetical protein